MRDDAFSSAWSYISHSVDDTQSLGQKIGSLAVSGMMILLTGDLGSGKTAITQGIAVGLLIAQHTVNSPTFTILKEHREGRLPLYHFDFYRIESITEIDELGFDDYFTSQGVCVIEWAERVPEIWGDDYLWIAFTPLDQDSRLLRFLARGLRSETLLKLLMHEEGIC